MQLVIQGKNLDMIWKYINPKMLFIRHLGGDTELTREIIEEMKQVCRREMKIYFTWNFYSSKIINQHFKFPSNKDGESITNYLKDDDAALFVVSAGEGIRCLYNKYKDEGEYLKSHAIQALALESAEAAAEWLHQQIRNTWGMPDAIDMTMMQRFQKRYLGCRYSFGYPACPDLEMQKPLFDLLRPEHVALTDGYMMEPEASVSAIVIKNPEAKYFKAIMEME